MLYDAYSLMAGLRQELNEFSTAYVQGTDITGRYNNQYLLSKINQAYRTLYSMLVQRIPGYFFASAEIAGVASVFTLPGDFGQITEIRDENGYKVIPVTPGNIPVSNATGEKNEYYRVGNTIKVNKDSVTATYTFYYKKKSRDLEFGMASAGAAQSITFPTSFSKVVDFYNGMSLNNITQDWTDTITDYATTRVATIAQTAVANDYVGLIPEIPEVFHHLIVPKATQLVKATFPLAQERPTQAELLLWNEMLAEALKVYGAEYADVGSGDLAGGS